MPEPSSIMKSVKMLEWNFLGDHERSLVSIKVDARLSFTTFLPLCGKLGEAFGEENVLNLMGNRA